MTQTPETKTPSRAIELLNRIDEQCNFVGHPVGGIEELKSIYHALSATDAPIVEGLETALMNAVKPSYSEENGEWCLWCGMKEHAQAILDAARLQLYAQGRTQSADADAPQRYWLIEQPDLEDDDEYKVIHTTDLDVYPDAKILGEYTLIKKQAGIGRDNQPHMDDLRLSAENALKAYSDCCHYNETQWDAFSEEVPDDAAISSLSAAPTPPVTGSAWLPIESAPKDGTMILLFYPMLYCTPNVQCVGHWTLHNGGSWQQEHGFSSNTPERPTHYQLLSAPPSSAEQTRGGV